MRCVYCGYPATRIVLSGAATCPAHSDLPVLDPHYNDHPRVLAGRRPAPKVSQGVSDVGVDSPRINGSAVPPRVQPA